MSGEVPQRRSGRDRAKRGSSSISHKPSTFPAIVSVDVSTFDTKQLEKLLSNVQFLAFADFVNVPDAVIKELFITDAHVTNRTSKILYPPKHRRRTPTQIRDWFRHGYNQQRQIIEDEVENVEEHIEIVVNHSDNLHWDGEKWIELEWNGFCMTTLPDPTPTPAPARPSSTSTNVPSNLKTPFPIDVQPRTCLGVTLSSIETMRLSSEERREQVLLGFKYTVKESFTMRAKLEHPLGNRWTFAPPVVGALMDGNDANKVRWVVTEDEHSPEADVFRHHHIFAVGCTRGVVPDGQKMCDACNNIQKRLFERFDSQLNQRKKFDPRTRHSIIERSGSLQKQLTDHFRRKSNNLSKKLARRNKVIDKLLEATGVDIPINKASDAVFSDDVSDHVQTFLNEKLGQDSIAAYAFQESVRTHKIAKEKGETAVRHCPLMIRLGAVVYKSMGFSGGLYDLVAKIAGFPSSRNLRRYTVANSNDPDGIMHKNCKSARDAFKRKFKGAGRYDYSRHCVLAFDSMHTKGRMAVGRNNNELVGLSDDAFDDNVLEAELRMLESNSEQEEDAEMKLPGLAKHFLVFIATTWTNEGKIQFLVARYGKASIKSPFLVREIRQIILACQFYGFIVDTIAADGASENRAAFKTLATLSAGDVLGDTFTSEELEGLPLDFKIAFPHPNREYAKKGYYVVIGGEMPHWVKKFRNAFDNKSRNLEFLGMQMNLGIVADIWVASGDADVTGGASLRKYKFTWDHFNLNSYLKMRVFLAVQIPSETTIKMIQHYCARPENFANIADFEPMIKIFKHVDRLVDIINGSGFKGGKDRNVELINEPRHRHILELFEILRTFEQWRKEAGKAKSKFLTIYTYEDLVWMVFGIAAVAKLYLKDDKSRTMHQGRGGSDVCEHFFSMMKYINSNPNMQQARECASSVSSDAGMLGAAFKTKRKDNSGSAPSDIKPADLLQKIHKSN